jgi:hypothetical protein
MSSERVRVTGRMSVVGAALMLASGAAGAMMLSACASDPTQGYSFSPAFRQDVRSIAVPIFQNDTFYHGAENLLTEAIVMELRRQTPYVLVDRSAAQTVLTGTIRSVDLGTLATDRETGLAAETAVQMSVDFSWADARTGRVLTVRRNFSAARSFVAARQGGERIETGQQQTIQTLARDIVAEMRSGW